MAKKEKKLEAPKAPRPPSKLTPVDVRRASFGSSAFGGYKKGEVQAFLERVAKSMEEILRDKRTLEEQMGELRAQLAAAEELRAEKNKLDEQLFLLAGEVDNYKKRIEEMEAQGSGASPEELEALRQENEALRQEYEALRAQMEAMGQREASPEVAELQAEIERLKGELEEARASSGGPAEMIAVAKSVAEKIKQGARTEARQVIQETLEKLKGVLEELE